MLFRPVLLLILTSVISATVPSPVQAQLQAVPTLSFFITSAGPGQGADLGGLVGADAHCQALAALAGAGATTWHAYLSAAATATSAAIDARTRIGDGPWYNAHGVLVAEDLETLHGTNHLTKATALTETGDVVNGRGDSPNRHDILTGSQTDGTAFDGGADRTCGNWTSSSAGSAQLGHHDRTGGGADPTSWNSAHASSGCSASHLAGTGGAGLFYCFALPAATSVVPSTWGVTKQGNCQTGQLTVRPHRGCDP